MSELQTSFGMVVGVGELEVVDEDFVLEVEVEVRVEEDETGDSETQRIWPIERSQFASRVGFQAYS